MLIETEVTLSTIISGRVNDPKQGWIAKQILLSERQKTSFLMVFGYGCSQRRKDCLEDFIDNYQRRKNRGVYDWVIFHPDDWSSPGEPCHFVGPGDAMHHVRQTMCGW